MVNIKKKKILILTILTSLENRVKLFNIIAVFQYLSVLARKICDCQFSKFLKLS